MVSFNFGDFGIQCGFDDFCSFNDSGGLIFLVAILRPVFISFRGFGIDGYLTLTVF